MDARSDTRVVLTLDAGGTSFRFSAVRGGEPAGTPVTLPSRGDDLEACLDNLLEGFQSVHEQAGGAAVAISFAFPGPADYPAGIIGDLGNLPAFRGGVAIGPMLRERFGLPVFINNDGDLFAYGEAIGGLLPEVNAALEAAGSPKRYKNLLGVTLGTGFGAGFVNDGRLFLGDNAAGAEIWLMRNKRDWESFAEEGVSIRAVRRAYAQEAGIPFDSAPDPKEIFEIAGGRLPGNVEAAREAFRRLGEVAGDALANAVTLLDAPVVVGGGLAGAAPLFLPALVAEMNRPMKDVSGGSVRRMEVAAFDLEEPSERERFLRGEATSVRVPRSSRSVVYDPFKRIGVGVSKLGTSRAVSLGAYAFALAALDGGAR